MRKKGKEPAPQQTGRSGDAGGISLPRSSDRWQCLPGSFDPLKTRWLFPSTNPWGIPDVPPAPLSAVPDWLAPYRTRIRGQTPGRGAVHFFLDDYRFESVWNTPFKALPSVRAWPVALSPDFSVYRDWPPVMQAWNVYRNRWCQAFWTAHGVTVIPSVGWSTPESYAFAFAGLARRGVVAVGTVGIRWTVERERALFEAGWNAMLETLKPVTVLVYGRLPEALAETAPVIAFPTRWEGITALRRRYGRPG